ncbi:hypothetical protein AGABI2DRAFT_120451 [Agaricus bisporus var. bisporus H97]|uniref:hypothetical protein n=1 Tax=Agaricus bisporus var. bisporus (strain H97 / ATCC MYA-4626 / FGSC 10389) TaxID=936046 RepID=UPI00029F7A58|nr:hypothetical protein AGABI2DRAFT_120451 [Agaricus bisporus var. bisporus H97]EKV44317.1 hypothetical protein AGABI2DRAFT_120451 [Agaricus bisporus var. bisporus H97]
MSDNPALLLVERDDKKQMRELYYSPEKTLHIVEKKSHREYRSKHQDTKELLTKIFLPAGYPNTVTPDYLLYQILNAAQAFCNSLASLLASRAALEGIGVGDPSATSTGAMLISVLQDIFGRIATIIGAYYLGTRLVPEAKKYRFLADVLNDIAVVVDVFNPVFSAFMFPGARVIGLCTSAALRAVCGVLAGGAKAAITLHFATPRGGVGDVGDLNAKDSSKETVLALLGMLLGSVLIPHITSPWVTYPVLLLLISVHLVINYIAVRGLAIRSPNRHRATIAWLWYRSKDECAPSPQAVASHELIFERPENIRDPTTSLVLGKCHVGSAPLDVMRGPALSKEYLDIFHADKYIVCFNPSHETGHLPIIHICFKEGFTRADELKSWIHAVEICRSIALNQVPVQKGALEHIRSTFQVVKEKYDHFVDHMKKAGWNFDESHLASGSGPKAVLLNIAQTPSRNIPT